MEKLGTNYGGWFIPKECKLDENSICFNNTNNYIIPSKNYII